MNINIQKILSCQQFDLTHINRYRTEVMGVAAISILLCHMPANVSQTPHLLGLLLSSLGMFGNSIFFFLSGVGMWFSLNKAEVNYKTWYKRRLLRLLVPYVLISFFIQLIHLCYGGNNLLDMARYILGLSFWLNGKGAWFVWALFVLYLTTPFLKKIFDQKWSLAYLSAVCVLDLLINLIPSSYNSIMLGVQQICSNAPIFFIGLWSAKYINQGFHVSIIGILAIHIILAVIRLIFHAHWFSMVVFAACPSVIIACCLIRLLNLQTNKTLLFFGSITLESYLFNTSLPGVFKLIPALATPSMDPVRYLLVLIVGIVLSIPVNHLAKAINKSL